MSSSLDYLELCRLCLVKDRVSVPIFEDEGDVRQIFLKITACLPVKVSREDKLPKKICDDCVYKVELFYQFWNTTANAEKQLLQWLGEVGGLEDKPGYVTEVLDTNVMKQETSSDSRLDGSVMQVGGHQNNMDMGMMDIITMPAGSEQQFTSVPMDTGGTVQTVQVVPGPSTQTTHDQMAQSQTSHLVGEESEEENSDDGCDNEEGLPVKEENDDHGDQPLETTFVALPCDEAGPSGLQQQKISELSEMSMQQTADNDPKTGTGTICWQGLNNQLIIISVKNAFDTEQEVEQASTQQVELPEEQQPLIVLQQRGQQSQQPIILFQEPHEQQPLVLLQQPLKQQSQQEQESTEQKIVLQAPQQEEIILEYKNSEDPMLQISEVVAAGPSVRKIVKRIRNPKLKTSITHRSSSNESTEVQTAQPSTSQEASAQLENSPTDDDDDDGGDEDVKDSNLNEDIFVRIDGGGYRCNVCQKTKLDRRNMLRHVVGQHSQIRPFKCNQCDKCFKRKYTLGIHQRSHDLKQSDGYKCEKCNYHTALKSSLYLHHYRMHTNEYRFTCEHCGKRCKFKRELVDHMVCHSDERYMCDICGKLYKGVHLLRAHRRIHLDPYKFPCALCKKKLATAESLQNHMKLHNRTFECDECGMKFSCKPNLIKHRNVHTREHAFACPECGKVFADQATQKVHSLIHAGLRPYRCNVCGLGFTQRTPMMLHWRKKHPGETEIPPPVILKNILKSIEEQNGKKAKLQNKE